MRERGSRATTLAARRALRGNEAENHGAIEAKRDEGGRRARVHPAAVRGKPRGLTLSRAVLPEVDGAEDGYGDEPADDPGLHDLIPVRARAPRPEPGGHDAVRDRLVAVRSAR